MFDGIIKKITVPLSKDTRAIVINRIMDSHAAFFSRWLLQIVFQERYPGDGGYHFNLAILTQCCNLLAVVRGHRGA